MWVLLLYLWQGRKVRFDRVYWRNQAIAKWIGVEEVV